MTQASPLAPAPAKPRLFYLDNLKTALTALVIAHHTSIVHGASGGWYYTLPPQEGSLSAVVLTLFTGINQSFFMSLFFLISAYFTPGSYDKKGASPFLRGRFVRLGIPLLGYFFVLNAAVIYLVRWCQGNVELGFLPFMYRYALQLNGTGPLWFVLSLLIFALIYAGMRAFVGPPEGERPLPGNRAILAFVVAVGLITFVVRFWYPPGTGLLGLQFGYFPLYICMYIFGALAYRYGWLNSLGSKQTNLWFGAAVALIVLLPFIMILGGALSGELEAFMGGLTWQALTYALWEPVLCVGISMKLLLVFRKRLNRENRLSKTLARSSYTAYILHPFFVVYGTYLMTHLPLDPMLRFLIHAPLAIATCYFVSNLIWRAPLLRRVL